MTYVCISCQSSNILGQYEKAIECYRKVLEFHPWAQNVSTTLQSVYYTMKIDQNSSSGGTNNSGVTNGAEFPAHESSSNGTIGVGNNSSVSESDILLGDISGGSELGNEAEELASKKKPVSTDENGDRLPTFGDENPQNERKD